MTTDGSTMIRGPLLVRLVAGRPGVQVGAFAQEENARRTLDRLTSVGFEARSAVSASGPIRVVAVAGRGESQSDLAMRLKRAGFAEQPPVETVEGGGVALQGEGGASLGAPTVRLVPLDPEPVRVGARSFRGEFDLRPAAQGVAVVNVVSVEEYLRGVVPAEMGPRSFPSLEALKAQAVAARTYAAAHLGDHAADGYDLCDSQACQVYEGAGAEHPLTDRAVLETAGEVVSWHGSPIDAMYHSTCAGHTEDAAALFADRAQPYLRGVPCTGEATLAVGAAGAPGPWLGPLDRLVAVAETLAAALGCPRDARGLAARLTGTSPGSGSEALASAFGLATVAATLHVAAGAGGGSEWDLLRTFRLDLPPPHAGERGRWEMALVVRLAQLAGKAEAISGHLVAGPSGARLVRDGGEEPRDLGAHPAVLVQKGERWRRASVAVPPGSLATLWCASGVCPLLEVEPMESADAASVWTWWVRELTVDEIGKRLGLPGVRDVRVLRRGASGRAIAVAVVTADGTTEVAGIPFRRALDLPDTLFVALPAGTGTHPALRFLGRGWGHGIGMCQNGAYGLARGGESYVEILKTYYTGVEISRWEGGRP